MKVKTSELPGIGKKYSVETANGARVIIITHHQGNREIYYFSDEDRDEPDFNMTLTDEEARQIGTLLVGVDYQPVADDRTELLLKKLRVDWLTVEPDSCLAGKSILESQIRKRTGATIIAIQRGDETIGSPDIDEVIRPGDVLMSIGTKDQTRSLDSMCHLADSE
jgi:TrkA domain protein